MWGQYPNIEQAYREQVRLRPFRNGCISLYVALFVNSPWARDFRSRFMPSRPRPKSFLEELFSKPPSLRESIKALLRGDSATYRSLLK